jgi:hypothetical protein
VSAKERGYVAMDMKDVMNQVREELRKQPDSHFSEVYLRTVERGASGTDVRVALYEMLKRDEVRVKEGKFRMIAPVERRKSA